MEEIYNLLKNRKIDFKKLLEYGFAKKENQYEYRTTLIKDEFEFLWEKSNNAIVRHKENNKWYAALLMVSKNKLGLDSDEVVDIIDLKMLPEDIEEIVDNENYFLGYHMNKKHWITIILDGRVKIEKIYEFIDISYHLK